MDFVIGKEIRKKIEEKGITFVAFSDKFGVTDRNLQYLFSKADLPISQIVRASEILDYDFISDYLKAKKPKFLKNENQSSLNEDGASHGLNKDLTKINFSMGLAGTSKSFEKFHELLQKTKAIAEDLGFKII